jgi:hypothetical protein
VHLHGYLLSFYQCPVGEIRSEIEPVPSSHWKLSPVELEQNGSPSPTTCSYCDLSKMHSKEPLPFAEIPWFFLPTLKTRQHPATGSKPGISVNTALCKEPSASWEKNANQSFCLRRVKLKEGDQGAIVGPLR